MLQADAPDSSEDAGPHPGLEPQVTGTPGTVLPRGTVLGLAESIAHTPAVRTLTVGRRLILHVVSGMGAVELHYGHTVGPAWGKPWPLKASTQAEMSSKLTSSSG